MLCQSSPIVEKKITPENFSGVIFGTYNPALRSPGKG
jgi:hypothetical protein